MSVALGEFGAPQHLSFLEDYVPGELSPRMFLNKTPREEKQGEGGEGNAEALTRLSIAG